MITRITGQLTRVLDEEVRLQIGPLEYQVLVPEFVRRHIQSRIGHEMISEPELVPGFGAKRRDPQRE